MRLALPLALCLCASSIARADGLDWEVREAPAGPAVTWLRGARDGVLGLVDDVMDVQQIGRASCRERV